MPLIKWRESLSVKIKTIDEQHKKLIKLINDLNDEMKNGHEKDAISKILKELKEYTVVHFGYEEKYFDKFGYPDKENHKRIHKKFVQKIEDFANDYAQNKISLSIDLMNFLSDWLRDHIMGTDKKYIDFFHQHGLKD